MVVLYILIGLLFFISFLFVVCALILSGRISKEEEKYCNLKKTNV